AQSPNTDRREALCPVQTRRPCDSDRLPRRGELDMRLHLRAWPLDGAATDPAQRVRRSDGSPARLSLQTRMSTAQIAICAKAGATGVLPTHRRSYLRPYALQRLPHSGRGHEPVLAVGSARLRDEGREVRMQVRTE